MAVHSREAKTGPATPAARDAWFTLDAGEVLKRLSVDGGQGLSTADAGERHRAHGPNALPAEKPEPGLMRFLGQYRSYMQIILLAAAVASILIGQMSMGVLLVILTLVNAVIGMKQEGKAASAMNALQSMTVSKVKVRRDGTLVEVDPAELVPGDILPVAAGEMIPADGRIISANALRVDESALTGESTPASKQVDVPSSDPGLALGDQVDMVFKGTNVTHGSGEMAVTAIGAGTQVGKVASMLKSTGREIPPLARQMNVITLWIAAAAGVTMIVMFAAGFLRKIGFDHLFDTAVALAVAAIPEALPTVLVVILSLGSVAMARRNAVVKSLPSVETLGEVSAINSDKTGTLTLNQMTVVSVAFGGHVDRVTGRGSQAGKLLRPVGAHDDPVRPLLPYVVANDAEIKDGQAVGDPLDAAFLVLAEKAGIDPVATRRALDVVALVPFDPEYKFAAAFTREKGADGRDVVRCYAKGAVPALLARSTSQMAGDGATDLDDAARTAIDQTVEEMERQGLRVMAGAVREFEAETFSAQADLVALVAGMTLGALTGMIDPPRPSAKDAIARAQDAHIQVRMVTGDDVVTAGAVARNLGIPGRAITGADLSAMTDDQALSEIDGIGVIARVAPADKERLVHLMQRKGYVVAATGDGVNDAPALKAADIGVAMGSGTDVAKESGRMILEDDDFSTIVFAVESGRAIYDNLQKYLRFILITLVAFVLTFLGSTLLNIAAGQPFSAIQILWINFLIDTPLGMALGFDRKSPGLMERSPVRRGSNVVTRGILVTAVGIGVVMTAALLVTIALAQRATGSAATASAMAITAFGFFRVVGAWQSRNGTRSALNMGTFDNPQLNWLVVAVVAVMFIATEEPTLARGLGLAPLTGSQWLICIGSGAGLFALWEIGKAMARARERSRTPSTA